MLEERYTVNELSKVWKCPPSTIRKYCQEGKLKAMKLGKKYSISKDSALNFITQQEDNLTIKYYHKHF